MSKSLVVAVVPHCIVLKNKKSFVSTAEGPVLVSEVFKQNLVEQCCFSLARVTADVQEA
jgi:hypothetical protein